MYYEHKRLITQGDWEDHFYNTPRRSGKCVLGSLSLSGIDASNTIKWISIDIDDHKQMEIWESKLRPLVVSKNIEYFIEWGGDEVDGKFDRCHVLIFYNDIPLQEATNHIKQLFYEIDEPIFAEESKHFNNKPVIFDEVFPINKDKNKIRPPFGHHLKHLRKGKDRRYPCEFNGQLLLDPVDVMYTIINIKSIEQTDIDVTVDKTVIEKLNERLTFAKKFEKNSIKRPMFFEPINLPLPFDNIPDKLQPVVRNCPAVNTLLHEVKDANLIRNRGSKYHDAQLMLRGITKYIDIMYQIGQGEEFYNFLRENYRLRDDADHNIEGGKHDDTPIRYFSKCEKWQKYFGLCDGCKFQETVGNPVRFIAGKNLQSYKLARVNLTTMEKVRTEDFPRLRKALIEDIERGFSKTITYGHFIGAGKSTGIIRLAIQELFNKNRTILLAVPTIELASEYEKALKELGVPSFILGSHKGYFNPDKPATRLADFPCPFYDEIQALDRLGVTASTYKKEYCAHCPLYDNCPYPRQYTDVHEPEHRVIIIQHAHFSCQEIIYDLMNKSFDVLFVDETFISSVFKFLPIKDEEIEAIAGIGADWSTDLVQWLKEESMPSGRIKADELELTIAKSIFDQRQLKWTLPDYIRFYNQQRLVNNHGIEVVYELPNVPIKVFTDATVPLQLTKHVTGIDNIETHGLDLILDPTTVHPENEVIQILDFTSSVTWLKEEDTFNLILDKIAVEVLATEPTHRSVITAYLADRVRVRKYLDDNHPIASKKIEISAIQKGVNKYAEFDSQYLMANIIFMPDDYYKLAYEYIQVTNYYLRKRGEESIPIPSFDFLKTSFESITRCEGKFILQYPQFQTRKPAKSNDIKNPQYWYRLIYEMVVGEVQQAIRVRLTPDKPRKITILNNLPLPSTMITKSIDLNGWLSSR